VSGTGGFRGKLMGSFTGSLYTKNRRKRELATASVFADPLADGSFVALGIKEIVGDLKGEAKGPTKPVEKGELSLGRGHRETAQLKRSPKERAGLSTVNTFHPRHLVVGARTGEVGDPASLKREVIDLAAHERLRPSGAGEHEAGPSCHRSRETAGEGFEGQRLKGIAAENRGGLVEGAMACGASSAEVVVVHCGQVIVDERIGVDHFHGHRGRSSGLPRSRFCQAVAPAARSRGPEHQRRPKSLAGREQGIPQRVSKARGRVARERQRRLKKRINKLPHPPQPLGHAIGHGIGHGIQAISDRRHGTM
jgi:hypothetical protein